MHSSGVLCHCSKCICWFLNMRFLAYAVTTVVFTAWRTSSHQQHGSMKSNRLFHLFTVTASCVSSPPCLPSIFYWWRCKKQAAAHNNKYLCTSLSASTQFCFYCCNADLDDSAKISSAAKAWVNTFFTLVRCSTQEQWQNGYHCYL